MVAASHYKTAFVQEGRIEAEEVLEAVRLVERMEVLWAVQGAAVAVEAVVEP